MKWIYDQVTVTRDRNGEDGQVMTKTMDLWRRDPVNVIRKLIGNPAFREVMAYEPEHVFQDKAMVERIIDEMWTADWWWEIQVSVLDHHNSYLNLPDLLIVLRMHCLRVPRLHLSFLPLIQLNCPGSEVTDQRGQCTCLSEISQRPHVGRLHLMQPFSSDTYRNLHSLVSRRPIEALQALEYFITVWRRY